jgi:hypothetical protein
MYTFPLNMYVSIYNLKHVKCYAINLPMYSTIFYFINVNYISL